MVIESAGEYITGVKLIDDLMFLNLGGLVSIWSLNAVAIFTFMSHIKHVISLCWSFSSVRFVRTSRREFYSGFYS